MDDNQGPRGLSGARGAPGLPGTNGRDGRDGRDGAAGPAGPRGYQGIQGGPGPDGKSAYEIALRRGFVGSEREWMASLHGRAGKDGVDGQHGKQGDVGPRGERGPAGPAGPIGPMPRHEWRGTELRFELAPDQWGQYVDLKGPAGSAIGTGGGAGPLRLPVPNTYFPSGW